MGPEGEAAVPLAVDLEADDAPDDVVVWFAGGPSARIQAKLRCGLGRSDHAFAEAMTQFKAAVRRDARPDGEGLVLVVNSASSHLRHLGTALDRRRMSRAGTPSPDEVRALAALTSMLTGLSGEEAEALMTRMHVVERTLVGPSSPAHEASALLLDGSVVGAGHGVEAVRCLVEQARTLAGLRAGADMRNWRDALRNRGIPLITDAVQSASAAAEARDGAIQRYRERMIATGSTIELLSFGFDLRVIDVQEPGEHLLARPLGTVSAHQVRLHWAVRRRGRCLLFGLPGSGKTVGLHQLASFWAQDPGAPLPVYVFLPSIRPHLGKKHLTEVVTDLTSQMVPAQDRTLVQTALLNHFFRGEVALFLDGLDECRADTGAVVAALGEWFRELPDHVEAVIATRGSSYGAAVTLGLPELELSPPSDLDTFLHQLLERYAEALRVARDRRDQWIDTRKRWVIEHRASQATIGDTAFHQVLLAAFAATNDIETIKPNRARVFQGVMEGLLDRLEIRHRRRGELIIGGLTGSEARHAAWEAFTFIGRTLENADGPAVSGILADLAQRLVSGWGLPIGAARAAADDAVHLWDEAGVFVFEGAGDRLRSRLRLFAELASAVFATGLGEPERREWIRARIVGSDTESLVLAAGLSGEIASEVIDVALASDDWEQEIIAARSVDEGAQPSASAIGGLARRMTERAFSTGGRRSYTAACCVARLPVLNEDRVSVLAAVEGLPGEWRAIPRMLAAANYGIDGGGIQQAAIDAIKVDARAIPGPRGAMVDHEYDTALYEAARAIIRSGDKANIDALPTRLGQVSEGTVRKVERMLTDAGHGDIVRGHRIDELRWVVGFVEREKRTRLNLAQFWTAIASSGEGGCGRGPSRRLSDLADLLATMDYFNWGMSDLEQAVSDERSRADLQETMRIVADLSGVPWERVSCDAAVLSRDGCEVEDVADAGEDRPLSTWPGGAAREDVRAALLRLLSAARLVAVTVANALVCDPEQDRTWMALDARLQERGIPHRTLVAEAAMSVANDQEKQAARWFVLRDGPLRIVAARTAARLFVGQPPVTSVVLRAIADEDAAVRHAATSQLTLTDLTPDVRLALERSLAEEPKRWTCSNCSASNRADEERCASCQEFGPQWHWRARDLLGQRQGVDIGDALTRAWGV